MLTVPQVRFSEPGAFDFSAHFHSRSKTITRRPNPSNPSTSATPIRIRLAHSNDLLSKHNSS
jgi:hypothetical protein